jgi:serine/threonine protein kinase
MSPDERSSREQRVNDAIAAYLQAVERGEAPTRSEFLAAHADLADELQSFFANQSQFRRAAGACDAVEFTAADESQCVAGDTDASHAEASGPADSQTGQREAGSSGDLPVLPAGTTLGRYVIERCLGRGGFGAVYLARDEELRRSVAVKVPRLENSASSELAERMLQEARTVAQLQHPGIVPVFDSGRTSEGNPYFVMEYVTGRSLEELLKNEELTIDRSVSLVAAVAEAIHFLHLRCFIHRDLKPGNILIDADGRPRLTDFGLAVHENEQRARAGERSGTLPDMAPEQVRGEVHRLDGRTDIWSLGVILYRLLTRRLPFGGNTQSQMIDEILNREPKPLRQINDRIPAELETVCLKCLCKDETRRYTAAADISASLRGYLVKASAGTESRGKDLDHSRDGSAIVYKRTVMPKWAAFAAVSSTLAIVALALNRGTSHRHEDVSPDQKSESGGVLDVPPAEVVQAGPAAEAVHAEPHFSLVRIVPDLCLWKNVYEGDDIARFEKDSDCLPRKWDDQMLRTVFDFLRERPPQAQDSQQYRHADSRVAKALQGPYESFRSLVIDNSMNDMGQLFALHELWPSEESMEILRAEDEETHFALRAFERDFLRRHQPVFDVILDNPSSHDVVLHSGLVEIRNVRGRRFNDPGVNYVYPKEKERRSGPLDVAVKYEWSLANLSETRLKERFELDPPVVLAGNESARIRVRMLDADDLNCEIRFGFIYRDQSIVSSPWFGYSSADNRTAEEKAQAALSAAKALIDLDANSAVRMLHKVSNKWPQTEAAREARKLVRAAILRARPP